MERDPGELGAFYQRVEDSLKEVGLLHRRSGRRREHPAIWPVVVARNHAIPMLSQTSGAWAVSRLVRRLCGAFGAEASSCGFGFPSMVPTSVRVNVAAIFSSLRVKETSLQRRPS